MSAGPSPPETLAQAEEAGGPTDAGAAAAKAARVRHACTFCFEKKIRCSGAHPCVRCTSKSLTCFFAEGGNSRREGGRKPAAAKSATARRSSSAVRRTKTTETKSSNGSEGDTPPRAPEDGSAAAASASHVAPAPRALQPIRQPYFRYFGLTAVSPPLPNSTPFKSISVTLTEQDPAVEARLALASACRTTGSAAPVLNRAGSTPESTIESFYDMFESFLPYAPKIQTLSACADGTLSEATFECMASLVSRMEGPGQVEAPERHADRARALVIPHLALPSLDVVYALLLLAYHEHGEDRDSGLWSYEGMAIRMSIDLGLHKPFAPGDDEMCALRSRVFWAVFALDRIISCGTGRPTTIPLSQIEVDLPPPRPIFTPDGQALVDPFPWLCKLLGLLGQISDTVNAFPAPARNDDPLLLGALLPFRQAVADFHSALPAELHFNIHNFQAYANAHYSQCFLLLSVWHQAVHLSLFEQGLFRSTPASGIDGDLSQSAAISITDMVCFADLVDPNAFLCTPVLSQALLMGGRAAITQMRALDPNSPPHKLEALRRSIGLCRSTLSRVEQYWRGLSWHSRTIESLSHSNVDVELIAGSGAVETKDRGMVARARLEDVTRNWLAQALAADVLTTHSSSEPVGVGVSLWGVTEEPPESAFAVLRSGGSSPFVWRSSIGGDDALASELYREGVGAEWFEWPPVEV
ncbi:hypothetical protein RQP46_000190 [Phenoliferia psychrophenolica]